MLGFLSLLFVQASPLRQLGISGAVGTFVALTLAYLIYPWFLYREKSYLETYQSKKSIISTGQFFKKRHGLIVLCVCGFATAAFQPSFLWRVTLLGRVFSDPSLLVDC